MVMVEVPDGVQVHQHRPGTGYEGVKNNEGKNVATFRIPRPCSWRDADAHRDDVNAGAGLKGTATWAKPR
jgi:hypothetical protein